jgi:hypothetical protein
MGLHLATRLHDTPADSNAKLSKSFSPNTEGDDCTISDDNDTELFESNGESKVALPYRRGVALAMYGGLCTRPDICFAVNACSRYSQNPGKAHWKALKRIFRYVLKTISLRLRLGGLLNSPSPQVYGFVDADWAGDSVHSMDTFKSTTGYILFMGANLGPVSWKSKMQKCVAKSSVESEYRATSQFSDTILWIRSLLNELGLTQSTPTTILSDSYGSIQSCFNPVNYKRLRHVEIQVHSIRERVSNGQVLPIWLPAELNVADIFTKPLARPLFQKFYLQVLGLAPCEYPKNALRVKKKDYGPRERTALDRLRQDVLLLRRLLSPDED